MKAPLACLLVYSIGPFFLLPTATEIDSVLKTFQRMDRYNPDKSWKVTGDDVEDDSEDYGSPNRKNKSSLTIYH